MNAANPAGDGTLIPFVKEPFRVGEPDVSGPLSVFPLFGGPPTLTYTSLARALEAGLKIGELDEGASVRDLILHNPLDTSVLLYEGEELIGAQQNRTLDVTILAGAHSKLTIPVSCMEAGRWDGRRHRESFRKAPQASNPRQRRAKSQEVYAAVAAGAPARADQSATWNRIAEYSDELGHHSATESMHDVYEGYRDRIAGLRSQVELRPEQTGAVCAISGAIVALDLVSRPDVFADLHPALVEGYALDAMSLETGAPVAAPQTESVDAFIDQVLATSITERGAVGLGRDARGASGQVITSGLLVDDELVQLTAYPAGDGDGAARPTRRTRINRPSRRHGPR